MYIRSAPRASTDGSSCHRSLPRSPFPRPCGRVGPSSQVAMGATARGLPSHRPRLKFPGMPITPETHRLYPIDWPELPRRVRFECTRGRCEQCGRPNGADVVYLGDGTCWDVQAKRWRDGRGRRVRGLPPPSVLEARQPPFDGLGPVRGLPVTRVVLAGCHLGHDPPRNRPRDLAALCRRCDMLHGAPSTTGRGGATGTSCGPWATCSPSSAGWRGKASRPAAQVGAAPLASRSRACVGLRSGRIAAPPGRGSTGAQVLATTAGAPAPLRPLALVSTAAFTASGPPAPRCRRCRPTGRARRALALPLSSCASYPNVHRHISAHMSRNGCRVIKANAMRASEQSRQTVLDHHRTNLRTRKPFSGMSVLTGDCALS